MFRIVNRLIQWTGKYKRRIYIGFIYAFIHSIFTAIPIMLAAKGLSAVLDDWVALNHWRAGTSGSCWGP